MIPIGILSAMSDLRKSVGRTTGSNGRASRSGDGDVACVIDAKHLCVNSRGIKDIESSTITAEFGGKFKEKETKREFLDYIKFDTKFE